MPVQKALTRFSRLLSDMLCWLGGRGCSTLEEEVLVKRNPYSQNGAVHLDRVRPGPTM
jgi:hypothetical protein